GPDSSGRSGARTTIFFPRFRLIHNRSTRFWYGSLTVVGDTLRRSANSRTLGKGSSGFTLPVAIWNTICSDSCLEIVTSRPLSMRICIGNGPVDATRNPPVAHIKNCASLESICLKLRYFRAEGSTPLKLAASATPVVNDRREIFGWMMYDWANSAFATTVAGVLLD